MRILGSIILFLSIVSAVLLYRTLKFGTFMHGLPYVLVITGTAIVAAGSESWDPLLLGLLFFVITALVHASVYYDIRKGSHNQR